MTACPHCEAYKREADRLRRAFHRAAEDAFSAGEMNERLRAVWKTLYDAAVYEIEPAN